VDQARSPKLKSSFCPAGYFAFTDTEGRAIRSNALRRNRIDFDKYVEIRPIPVAFCRFCPSFHGSWSGVEHLGRRAIPKNWLRTRPGV
jgi:hypothetical protein